MHLLLRALLEDLAVGLQGAVLRMKTTLSSCSSVDAYPRTVCPSRKEPDNSITITITVTVTFTITIAMNYYYFNYY